jgi:hypothetical protein
MSRDGFVSKNDLAVCSAMLSAQVFSVSVDFVKHRERFQVTTTYDIFKTCHDGILRAVVTLYPETERLVGYIICTTTMEAFDADDGPLGMFPDCDSALDAILAAYLKRGADQ